jgi:hypothetical protein
METGSKWILLTNLDGNRLEGTVGLNILSNVKGKIDQNDR